MVVSEERPLVIFSSFRRVIYYYYYFSIVSKGWRHFLAMTNMKTKAEVCYIMHTPCRQANKITLSQNLKISDPISQYTDKFDTLSSLCIFAADLGVPNSNAQ